MVRESKKKLIRRSRLTGNWHSVSDPIGSEILYPLTVLSYGSSLESRIHGPAADCWAAVESGLKSGYSEGRKLLKK